MKRIDNYILEYTAYSEEPLHLLISAVLADQLCKTPYEIVTPLIELQRRGFIEAYSHSGLQGDPYEPANDLREEDLFSYINRNIKSGFNTYPKRGGEYFFRATDKGYMKVGRP